ncbi:MAG TPA: gephyrin-like molybdotransferase Glp [Longimicrobiales bacterium]
MAEQRESRRADWIGVREAVERILAAAAPLGTERVALADAAGRTLAEDVRSTVDHPPWDNSAMDGYAVRAADVRGATPDVPALLEVVESVPAGRFPTRAVGPGQAIRVMTGAPVPEGADSVVRLEYTEPRPGVPEWIAVLGDADAGRNIRRRGEDLRAGTVVLEAGKVLRPGEIGVLAAVGRAEVEVARKPAVGILSTGDELAGLDAFEEVQAGRRIADSNSHALAAAVALAGGEPVRLGIARDDEASLREHLAPAAMLDVLVTTAGVSVGEHDMVRDVLERLGLELDFWRVRMRPGSPASFGRLGRTLVFGLPGNPVSALVTFEVLVRPALRRLGGRRDVHSRTVRVRVAEPISSRGRLTHFLRVRLERDGAGGYVARLTGPQGSGILSSMARADALLIVPEDVDHVEAGEELEAIPLLPADAGQEESGLPE